MTPEEAELRERVDRLAHGFLDEGDSFGWFDELYRNANGNIDEIPWADLKPNRFFTSQFESLDLDPGKALVVGCGLGDEAGYLAEHGFDVTAFDVSQEAIEWAKRVNEDKGIDFRVADLFNAPDEWRGAFDFVAEVYTIQALPLEIRTATIRAISDFVKSGGTLIAVQRLRPEGVEPTGPPWAVSRDEIDEFQRQGLAEHFFEVYESDGGDPFDRFAAVYRKQ
ncbi:MAG: methyltransferase domain-containing protein [Pyrinomonadaceae bacterium]